MLSLQAILLACAIGGGSEPILYDFCADWCGPCRAMEPTVHQLAEQGYPVQKVNIDQNPALAAKYHVQAIPCFVLTVDGQQIDRVEGSTSIDRLRQMFDRVPKNKASNDPFTARGQNLPLGPAPLPIPRENSTDPLTPGRANAIPPAPSTVANPPANELVELLLAASVRLKIDDPDGHSYGSGTVIDAGDGEALILTCGHIFRDSQGQGKISVDFFGEGAPQGIPGQLVDYDLKSDVGLVSIRTGHAVTPLRVAPAGYAIAKGMSVVSVGCNNGDPPTARQSRVTGINKFLGPPNLQVAGQPVTGRSGGGLFTPEGYVIGVCNAADPTDDEGLYAALASIHAELDRTQLASVYGAAGDSNASLAANSAAAPDMPAVMPPFEGQPGPADREERGILRPSAVAREPRGNLSSVEDAALAEIRQQSDAAEVICIIRSHTDPNAQSEIIVLDKASTGFLEGLASERRAQDARMLTSLSRPKHKEPAPRKKSAANSEAPKPPAKVARRSTSNWKPSWRQP